MKDFKLLELSKHIKIVLDELGIYENIPSYMQEHMKDTPYRIVKAWKEFTNSLNENLVLPTMFSNQTNELVYVTDINFNSLCCHHFFPFSGLVHIAYLPDDNLPGLSKIPRIVKHFAKRPQIQEIMVCEISDYIFENVKPEFLMVICKAYHTCCSGRGVESSSPMIVSAIRYKENMSNDNIKELKKEVMETISMKNNI